jgi:Ca2+-transporting ATPase
VQPHQLDVQEVLDELKTAREGLSDEEALSRLHRYGPNELVERKKKSALAMFLGQFSDFMILVLIAAAVISGIIGELSDTIAIVVIVVLNAVLGFTQEYRAEQAMAALKKMAASTPRSSGGDARDRSRVTTRSRNIVALYVGNIVPPTGIIEAARLRRKKPRLRASRWPLKNIRTPVATRQRLSATGRTCSTKARSSPMAGVSA